MRRPRCATYPKPNLTLTLILALTLTLTRCAASHPSSSSSRRRRRCALLPYLLWLYPLGLYLPRLNSLGLYSL